LVQPGALVSVLVSLNNVGNHQVGGAIVHPGVLPAGLNLVPGSVTLINGNYPTGFPYSSDSAFRDGFGIGNYNPGIDAFFLFRVRIDTSGFPCGLTTLVENATVSANGVPTFSGEAATLVVTTPC
jgi:uncharacterized repeat protein (TIGR01451 family)